MKTFVFALSIAVLIAFQLFTPASAAAPAASAESSSCGDTYTVQRGDFLARIARYCGTTVAEILSLNPQIYNRNLIYAGQVLRMTENADIGITYHDPRYWRPYYGYYYYPYTVYSGYARVTLSATRAKEGDTLTVYVRGFPANTEIDYRLGQQGEAFSVVVDGKTDANGADSETITVPSDADGGEYWVVHVITTSGTKGVQVYSARIYITD